jgi:hypothetical protein
MRSKWRPIEYHRPPRRWIRQYSEEIVSLRQAAIKILSFSFPQSEFSLRHLPHPRRCSRAGRLRNPWSVMTTAAQVLRGLVVPLVTYQEGNIPCHGKERPRPAGGRHEREALFDLRLTGKMESNERPL